MRKTTHTNFCQLIKMDKENDILIVDPFAINMNDIEGAGIKNVIRVRRPLWGKGVSITVCQEGIFSRIWRKLTRKEKT